MNRTPHSEVVFGSPIGGLSEGEMEVLDRLEADLCDGMTTYKSVVSIYHPFNLCRYLSGAPNPRERRHRVHVLAEAFAVAFEFDGELPYRLRASHDLDLAAIELFETLDLTGELPPSLTAAMVTP